MKQLLAFRAIAIHSLFNSLISCTFMIGARIPVWIRIIDCIPLTCCRIFLFFYRLCCTTTKQDIKKAHSCKTYDYWLFINVCHPRVPTSDHILDNSTKYTLQLFDKLHIHEMDKETNTDQNN